ncbi:YoaK family protein [Hymenobacter daeguensis]
MALEIETRIKHLSILLTLVAGFCDTVTFVAADSLFSAHVTGNFIVFAYDAVHHVDAHAWTKLVSFPVFVAAVVAGRWIGGRAPSRYALLLWEAGLLLAAGGLVLALLVLHDRTVGLMQLAAMLVVFAMGLQNAFGRLFAKETYGPTTVMTGNVTQATLDVVAWLRTPGPAAGQVAGLRKQLLMIGAFLLGCLAGAIAARVAGLVVVAGAGAALAVAALGWHRQAQREVSGSALLS